MKWPIHAMVDALVWTGLGWSGLGDRVETVDDMPVTAGLFAIQKLARQTLHKIINTI